MSWGGEGIPGDVEPGGGGEELVGMGIGAEDVNQKVELRGILGADVGGLAKKVLRAPDTTNKGVDARVAEAGVDDEGADRLSGGLQQHEAAKGHVHHVLHGGLVVGVLLAVDEFFESKVGREASVIECCFCCLVHSFCVFFNG